MLKDGLKSRSKVSARNLDDGLVSRRHVDEDQEPLVPKLEVVRLDLNIERPQDGRS